jgi:hypothetical protein
VQQIDFFGILFLSLADQFVVFFPPHKDVPFGWHFVLYFLFDVSEMNVKVKVEL